MKPVHIALVCISRVGPAEATHSTYAPTSRMATVEVEAVHHDELLDVRGVLVCAANYFVQWLEGPSADVLELFERIQQDPRHAEVRCVYRGAATNLLKGWSVGVMSRPDLDRFVFPFLRALPEATPDQPGGMSPAAIFQGLLMPRKISGNAPAPLSRVGLFGQTGVWPTSVLMHLSHHWDRPLGRSRLMLGNDTQVHSVVLEYLTAVHPKLGALRLENFSGDIAQLDVVPALVENLDAAVLFMAQGQWAEQEAYFRECVERLGEANKGIFLLCVFSQRSAEHMPVLTALANRLGRQVRVQACSLSDTNAIVVDVEEELLRQMAERPAAPKLPAPLPTIEVLRAVASVMPLDIELPPLDPTAPEGEVEPGAGTEPEVELAAEWLKAVAAIDGVAAVALRVPTDQGEVMLSDGDAASSLNGEDGGEDAGNVALRLHALMDGLADFAALGQPSTQWLLRTDCRLLLAMAVPGQAGWVLALESAHGAVNAGLLLSALRERMPLLQPELQAG